MADNSTEVNSEQIESLGKKLDEFSENLDAEERKVLGWILQTAAKSGASESGELSDEQLENIAGGLSLSRTTLGYKSPTSSALATSLGQIKPIGSTDLVAFRVSWSW